jgi:hypothetical protein
MKVFSTEEAALAFADHLSRRGNTFSRGGEKYEATNNFIDDNNGYVFASPDTIYDKIMFDCDDTDCEICAHVHGKKMSWNMCYGRICIAKRQLEQ